MDVRNSSSKIRPPRRWQRLIIPHSIWSQSIPADDRFSLRNHLARCKSLIGRQYSPESTCEPHARESTQCSGHHSLIIQSCCVPFGGYSVLSLENTQMFCINWPMIISSFSGRHAACCSRYSCAHNIAMVHVNDLFAPSIRRSSLQFHEQINWIAPMS